MNFHRLLFLNQLCLSPSAEWDVSASVWRFARISEGTGYLLGDFEARETVPGEVLLFSPGTRGSLRASRLAPLKCHHFDFSPELLSGFLTLAERHYFELLAKQPHSKVRVLPPDHKTSQLFTELVATGAGQGHLLARCQMLHLTAAVFAQEISKHEEEMVPSTSASERFKQLITEMPDGAILDRSPEELARICGCSLRHFSRLFRGQFAVSLREKQTELRLMKARQLLSNTDTKIVHVALESGYRHLGLFNMMFKRYLGMTPSEWRQKHLRREGAKFRKAAAIITLGGVLAAFSAEAELVEKDSAPKPQGSSQTNSPPKTFEVKGYEIKGNTLFRYDDMEPIFTKYVGKAVTFQTIRDALAEFQMAYRNRGFVTVAVSLPQQQLTNGLVKVQVTEGRLAEINVINNRHFSSNNIMRALPGLRTNMLLNSLAFQQDLDRANANKDRQIYPVMGPGPDPGTTALSLKVKDRLPVHGRLELNNYSTPNTPELRLNLAAQYNNLWQREHQVGLQYNFTPEELKAENQGARFFDQPLIASYSAFYRMPLAFVENETRRRDPRIGDFGYDEVNRRFRPPPLEDFADLIFYASRSFSDSGHQLQSETLNPAILPPTGGPQVSDSLFSQTLTHNENVGFRLSSPLPGFWNLRSSVSAGLDYKIYRSDGSQDRVFAASLFVPESGPTGPPFTVFNSGETRQSQQFSSAVRYLPFALNWEGGRQDKWGTTAVNINNTFHWSGLLDNEADFRRISGSRQTTGNYYIGNYGLTREQTIYGQWGVRLHADGQWANEPLINNEQFALGGLAGARGYRDGQEYGDTGWRAQFEPHTPLFNLGMVDTTLPMYARFSIFTDYGQRYLIDPGSRPGSLSMWGAGFAVNATIGDRFDFRFTYGISLKDIPGVTAGSSRFSFAIGGQF